MTEKAQCTFCKRKFTDIDKHLKFCVKNSENVKTPSVTKTGEAKFERPYYIWENGKKTHIRFIQLAIQRGHPLPIGFYEAAKNNKDKGILRMLQVAKIRKIKATVEMLDTRQ